MGHDDIELLHHLVINICSESQGQSLGLLSLASAAFPRHKALSQFVFCAPANQCKLSKIPKGVRMCMEESYDAMSLPCVTLPLDAYSVHK